MAWKGIQPKVGGDRVGDARQLLRGISRITGNCCPVTYELGQKISDDEMSQIRLKPHKTHPDWNYTFAPHHNSKQQTSFCGNPLAY